jgi:hypothetical protein
MARGSERSLVSTLRNCRVDYEMAFVCIVSAACAKQCNRICGEMRLISTSLFLFSFWIAVAALQKNHFGVSLEEARCHSAGVAAPHNNCLPFALPANEHLGKVILTAICTRFMFSMLVFVVTEEGKP